MNWSWGSNPWWQIHEFTVQDSIGIVSFDIDLFCFQCIGCRVRAISSRSAGPCVQRWVICFMLNLKLSLVTYIQLYPKSLFFLRINKTTKCTFSPLECTTCDWSARRLSSDMFSRCRQIRNKTPGCVILFGHFVAFFFRGINAQYSTALQVALFWWLLIDWAQYEMPASLPSSLTERSLR